MTGDASHLGETACGFFQVLDDLALTCQLQCAGLHLLGDHSEAVVEIRGDGSTLEGVSILARGAPKCQTAPTPRCANNWNVNANNSCDA